MRESRGTGLRAFGLAAALASLACGSSSCRPAELPVLGEVSAFRLVDHGGRPFANTDLAGRPWLASFLYTTCPGPCPRLVQRLKLVRGRIPASSLAMVSFSVDPETDTPEVLAAYRAAHGIDDDQAWTFVTGPPEKVLELVRAGFLTAVERSGSSSADGPVIHGVRVALVDASGRIRGYYSPQDDDDLSRLAADVRSLGRT